MKFLICVLVALALVLPTQANPCSSNNSVALAEATLGSLTAQEITWDAAREIARDAGGQLSETQIKAIASHFGGDQYVLSVLKVTPTRGVPIVVYYVFDATGRVVDSNMPVSKGFIPAGWQETFDKLNELEFAASGGDSSGS